VLLEVDPKALELLEAAPLSLERSAESELVAEAAAELLVAVAVLEDELLEDSFDAMSESFVDLILFNIFFGREVAPPDFESVLSLESDDEPIE